jgi:hypothetical protein
MECGELRLGTCARIHGVACPEQQTHYDAIGVADAKDEKKFYGTSACREQLCTGAVVAGAHPAAFAISKTRRASGRCSRPIRCSSSCFRSPRPRPHDRASAGPARPRLARPHPAPVALLTLRVTLPSPSNPPHPSLHLLGSRAFDFAAHFAVHLKPAAS